MTISSNSIVAEVKKPAKVEGLKENSNFLREPVATELLQDSNHFSEQAIQILKFHGSYQQDNRDNRVKGQEKDYQFMLRTRSPGGFIPPQLYLTLDKLADTYGNGTLRATTRQGFQLHGILKQNLKVTIAEIVHNMGSTLGACGDLNRNVMAPPAPYRDRPEYAYAWEYANRIADLLTPQTGAYYEIWLDGEKIVSGEEAPEVKAARQSGSHGVMIAGSEEPIYGTHYMPRKFKCCVTVPGDNSVDLYSQDVSLVVITDEQGNLQGFNVLAGGGLGRTHNKEETFPRLADPIGYVDKDDVYELVKAIVATQRDYGDRTDRRHARMKYLVEDWGVEKFRDKVEDYFGKSIAPFKSLPAFKYLDFLGWHEQGNGNLFLGISVENGRIKNAETLQLKTALREIVQQFNLPMRLTPNHNVILYEISPDQKDPIQAILDRCGVRKETEIDPLVRYSMACPALPTCGLAITESERALPGIVERIRILLDRIGLEHEHPVIRMTGCPNGCARPYLAELGFVGSAPEQYQLWLGADPNQTRLSRVYVDKLHINDLEAELEPIFIFFSQNRLSSESFGDFCNRIGMESIRNFVATYRGVTPVMDNDAQLPSAPSNGQAINHELKSEQPTIEQVSPEPILGEPLSDQQSSSEQLTGEQPIVAQTPEFSDHAEASTRTEQLSAETDVSLKVEEPILPFEQASAPVEADPVSTPELDAPPVMPTATTAEVMSSSSESASSVVSESTTPTISSEPAALTGEPLTASTDPAMAGEGTDSEDSQATLASKTRHRISISDSIYVRMVQLAKRKGIKVSQITSEAIDSYLQSNDS